MSDSVLERMIHSFMATDQSQYAFAWQGGEPTLMGLDFFKRVTALQQKGGRSGAIVANGLQTNGTMLSDEFARHLADHRFLVGVSLDGPPEVHDRYRRYVGGKGSHTDVMRGIGFLKENKVEFNILTLVTRASVRNARQIYQYLCENGFLFHQYIECVEFDGGGEVLPLAVHGEEWGDFLCEIYDEWIKGDVRRVSIRLFDSILQMMVDGVANVCQMGRDCRQYFVVEYKGDVYPCDFFVEPELKLGNIMENSWQDLLGSHVYADFGRRKSEWNSKCDECEYLRFCAGDCPKNRFRAGRDPKRLSELCEGWKQFYKHSLAGFRLLAEEIRREREDAGIGDPGSGVDSSSFAGTSERRKPSTRPGRNDPCPCGSGKKYKKCCGSAMAESQRPSNI